MIGLRILLLVLLLSISVPSVLCRFNYQYFINKYHKGVSTTENSLTPDDSSETSEEIENELPMKGTQEDGYIVNGTVLQGNVNYDVDIQYMFIMRIVVIVGSVIVFVVVLGCIVCCCPRCCRGNERRGFIIRDNREAAHPQQPLVSQQPQQQPVLVQHFPPNYTQEQAQQFPAPYPQQLPPQYQQPYCPQYSPGLPDPQTSPQFHNPPEAPPPYEYKSSHKY